MLDQMLSTTPVWLDEDDCDIEGFRRHVSRRTDPAAYPHAAEIAMNVPVYDGGTLRGTLAEEAGARRVMAEWNRAFLSGPGIIAIRGGFADLALIDAVTEELCAIIVEEEAGGAGKGDHFAASGANSRIWNAHEKLCARPRSSRATTRARSSAASANPGSARAIRSQRR